MKVVIGSPHYSGIGSSDDIPRGCFAATNRDEVDTIVKRIGGSALTKGFNYLLCEALSDPDASHFALLHEDTQPEDYWLDPLFDIQVQTGAIVTSVASPIKNDLGLTSTGLQNPSNPFHVRRLSLREIHHLPEVFDQAAFEECRLGERLSHLPPWPIVFNTGCMLIDLRGGHFHRVNEQGITRFWFGFNDRIRRDAKGKYHSDFEPEDWFFSRQLREEKIPFNVTRSVKLRHRGTMQFVNSIPWGRYDTDKDFEL